ncbi:MAG: LuxR C-terminal-related transcriptional regulator [Sandaracinaceae bacterium]
MATELAVRGEGWRADARLWRAILRGALVVSGTHFRGGVHHVHWTWANAARPLTPTEGVALALVLFGATNERAAQELRVDATTVASHLSRVRRKLVANRTELLSLGPTAARLRARGSAALPGATLSSATPANAIATLPLTSLGLTPSEQDIARKLASGDANRAIARSRGTSPRTIADQLDKLYRKAGVHDRRELTLWLYGVRSRAINRADALRLLRYGQATAMR